ncbi:KTSC domain-containing protein [Mucilaginibacter antarcticus]|uniref:KTSC domain-containing protein n=1 Tax=Mucilaginibacter antarcticus TaxID=1855725 RepID=A0ABW5XTX9_9SPHI
MKKRSSQNQKTNAMPSAVIAHYDYNAPTETLTIRYHSGKVYNYLNVPAKVFSQMRSTIVKGIWFNRHIKGKYPFEDVTPGLGQTKLFGPA